MSPDELRVCRAQLLAKATRFAMDPSNDGDPEMTRYAAQLAILDLAIKATELGNLLIASAQAPAPKPSDER